MMRLRRAVIGEWAADAPLAGSPRESLGARILWIVPFALYLPWTAALIWHYATSGDTPGYDGWLYRKAAEAFVQGGDPWAIGVSTAHFSGAPSVIAVFLPTVLLPPDLWRVLSVVVCLAIAVAILIRVRLSMVWLAWPPLAVGILLGQPGVIILGLLLSPLAFIAPSIKAWAAIPLLGRPRMLLVSVIFGFLTVVLLPGLWLSWFDRLPELSARLVNELHGGIPLWASVVGGIAAVVIWYYRRSEAFWLGVSAVWPFPEYHNAILALPVRRPALLLGFSLIPGPPVVVAYASWLLLTECLLPRVSSTGRTPAWLSDVRGGSRSQSSSGRTG